MSDKVKVVINGNKVLVNTGTRLSDLLDIEKPCGGKGTCGKCKVKVNEKEELACKYIINSNIQVETYKQSKIISETGIQSSGKLTENLVLEQLVSSGFDPICYWFNDTGKAEVDFLIQDDRGVIPIEVKSGLSLKAKSLKTYRAQFKPHIAVRASMQNLKLDDGLLNVPLYLLGELPRLLSLAEEK